MNRKSGVKFFNDLPTEQKKITVDKVTIMECDPESTSVNIQFFPKSNSIHYYALTVEL